MTTVIGVISSSLVGCKNTRIPYFEFSMASHYRRIMAGVIYYLTYDLLQTLPPRLSLGIIFTIEAKNSFVK